MTVAFVGLGVMGKPMARHLLAGLGDEPLLVHTRTHQRAVDLLAAGATWAPAGTDLAAAHTVVFMVPDLPQVIDVVDGADGLLAAVTAPVTIVVSSTTSATDLVAFARDAHARSGGLVSVVDAPVSGGEEGAIAGTLSIMVGGSDDAVGPVLPVLATMGNPVHLGPLGSGQIAKAANQMIVAATVHALGEAAVLAERAGIDVAALFALLQGGYAGSRLLAVKARRFAEHDHSPSGPAKFLVKDLTAALAVAADLAVYTPQTELLKAEFTALTAAGLGDLDTAVVQAWIESQSGAGT